MPAELHWLSDAASDEMARAEAIVAAGALFDGPVRADWAADFLSQKNHQLCIAYLDGEPAGFVSGVELTHPDKGREMFLYELGVADACRGQGIGRALVRALSERARARGCYGMWTLTDADNDAALATYRSAGSGPASAHVMLDWDLPPDGAAN